jgi:hypothetical protein
MPSPDIEYDEYDISDDETEYDDIYEPEELSITKYNIVLCEKYNEMFHGISNPELNYHYLIHFRFKRLDMNIINTYFEYEEFDNCRLEIAQCIYLPSEHCISIIKTLWLKLIQRKWKKIFNERKLCLSKRCNPNALKYKEIYGRWPNNCLIYPSLKGMLSDLSRSFS